MKAELLPWLGEEEYKITVAASLLAGVPHSPMHTFSIGENPVVRKWRDKLIEALRRGDLSYVGYDGKSHPDKFHSLEPLAK